MKTHISETSLKDAIGEFNAQMASQIPAEVLAVLGPELERLGRSSFGAESPKLGSIAPSFALPEARGGTVRLADVLVQGPAVVTFYRGGWCPFCNLQLRAYQSILPAIKEFGATLIAISPQTPDHSLSAAEEKGLGFPVLSDKHNEVARSYGLVFKLSDALQGLQKMFGNEPPKFNGDESWELPVPATFVIDQGGIVRLAFYDPDYTKRLEPAAILEALRAIRA